MNQVGLHPSRDELIAYSLGRLTAESADAVHAHLESCPDCRTQVESAPDDTLTALVREVVTPVAGPPEASPALPNGMDPYVLRGHPRYEVLEFLGAGGMGMVYRARHRFMERAVALKVLHRRVTEKPAAVERFRREVQAVASLGHPNIVAAFDADQAGEQHFLVMEYVPGVTLARLVAEQGPLEPAHACDYIRQAALGLQHAHERGLVHRDLKPSNLIVTPDGQVKILDLGLARLGQSAENTGDDLTESGTFMGSVDYLAPEQADDPHKADTRADIYSLGCTLYHLLTGRPPFPEGTLMQKLKAHGQRAPAPLDRPGVAMPAGLDRVVGRMLAKDPRQRYQTPGELAEALAPYAAGKKLPARPPRRGRRLALAASLLAVLVAAAVIYRVATDRGDIIIVTDDPDVEVVVKKNGELVTILDGKTKQKITLYSGEYTLSLNGDAEGLKVEMPPTLVLRRGDKVVVKITRLPADEITHWKAHDREVMLALDPAGKILASAGQDGMIRLWNVTDGKGLRSWQAHTGKVMNIVFSPDGKRLASGGWDQALKWWETATGKLLGSVEAAYPWCLSFTADGKALFAGVNLDGKGGTLRRVDLETQKDQDLANYGTFILNVPMGVDRRMLAVSHDRKVRLWDTLTEKETLQFEITSNQVTALVFHPKGKLLAVGGDKAELGLWDLSGNLKVTMAGLKQPVICAGFAPDGKLLVSGGGQWRTPDGTGEIKVWDAATGKELAILGKDLSCVSRVVVAADGKTCFTGHFDGRIYKWRLRKPPAESKRLPPAEISSFAGHTDEVRALKLSANGKTLISASHDWKIRFWDTGTLKETREPFDNGEAVRSLALSPDNKSLASGGWGVAHKARWWDLDTGKLVNSTEEHAVWVQGLAFSADNKTLFASTDIVHRVDLVTGKCTDLIDYRPNAGIYGLDVDKTGRYLAVATCNDAKLHLWDLSERKEAFTVEVPVKQVFVVAFNPDGTLLAAGGDKYLGLWDLSGKQKHLLTGHNQAVRAIAFSADGKLMVSASAQWPRPTGKGEIKVWDVATGKHLVDLGANLNPVFSVAVLPDGRTCFTGHSDGMIRKWRLPKVPDKK